MCVWTDGGLGEYPEKQILTQYPFYPTLLTYAERIWRGAKESANQFVANMPKKVVMHGSHLMSLKIV